MRKKKRKTKKIIKSKPKAELTPDEKERQKRDRQKQKLAAQRRRGMIVDFTKMKKGSMSIRNHKIQKCPDCGKNGEMTELGLSRIFLHRGFLRPGEMLRNNAGKELPRVKMTEYCLV